MKISVPSPCQDSGAIEQKWMEIEVPEVCYQCENFMDFDIGNPSVGCCKHVLDKNLKDGLSLYEAIYQSVVTNDDDCEFDGFAYKD